jgi:hypothetical protein
MPRLLPAAALRIGSPAIRLTPRRSRRAVLGLVAEAEAASQHTPFHTRIARSSLDVPANIVDLVGTTPTTSHDFASRKRTAPDRPASRLGGARGSRRLVRPIVPMVSTRTAPRQSAGSARTQIAAGQIETRLAVPIVANLLGAGRSALRVRDRTCVHRTLALPVASLAPAAWRRGGRSSSRSFRRWVCHVRNRHGRIHRSAPHAPAESCRPGPAWRRRSPATGWRQRTSR